MRGQKNTRGKHRRSATFESAITQRDFLNGVMLGAGTSLLGAQAPLLASGPTLASPNQAWYGFGGIGDYASSHGNTPEVVARAHEIMQGRFDDPAASAIKDPESYDVVIVGAGIAGLGAAFEFTKSRKANQSCLVLENHPIFGGESKRNEFEVNGQHLIAPQGANSFFVPAPTGGEATYAKGDAHYYAELNVPRKFTYQAWADENRRLQFGSDNYGFLYWLEQTASTGYFFDPRSDETEARWVRDPWRNKLREMPYRSSDKQDLMTWRFGESKPYDGADYERWLDTMSYKDYIEKVMGLGSAVTAHADPILASSVGLGCDAVSAYAAYAILLPGVNAFQPAELRDFSNLERHSFPGGNDGFARYFIKRIIPDAIEGTDSFEDILNQPVSFDAMDRAGQAVRLRLNSTVVRVEHEKSPAGSDHVLVTYVRENQLHRVRTRAVVMATGAWVNKYAVRDLPDSYAAAFAEFQHSAFLVANVALTNWRFLYELGITACRWSGGFGTSCNIRQPMMVGDYQPPLTPDQPIVLSFYVPFYYPGETARKQGTLGRTDMLGSSYAEYENRILAQMKRLFASAGFDAQRDVAGIILNRCGHAYVAPTPGFYFGQNGRPAPRDVVRERFGRIAFGHSELHGNQHWGSAANEGARAMQQVLETV